MSLSSRSIRSTRPLASVRSQTALVRALLDEVERRVPRDSDLAVDAQLVEEIARLGCRFVEVASELTEALDVADDVARCA